MLSGHYEKKSNFVKHHPMTIHEHWGSIMFVHVVLTENPFLITFRYRHRYFLFIIVCEREREREREGERKVLRWLSFWISDQCKN